MSLDYSTAGIANANTVCFEELNEEIKMRQITRQLIFFTERVGIPRITKDNYVDFWVRVNAWERVNGHAMFFMGDDDKPVGRYVTLQEVRDHVGLSTNARKLTDSKFHADILGVILQEVSELLVTQKRECETLPTTKATPPTQ